MTDASPSTLGSLLAHARRMLADAGIADASLDARLLVEHFTGTSRTEAVLDPHKRITAEAAAAVLAALDRRLAGEPVHRIVGSREFYGMRLALSAATLEPRPDTEALVNLALPHLRAAAERHGLCRLLDLGTGTGAIALALLSQEPRSTALATDISGEALATAAGNADITGNKERFRTLQSDWFSAVEGRFHVIVSNPPYIASEEIGVLEREVRDHDPLAALDGGPDGLAAYRKIAAGAAAHLEHDGMIAVEIGHHQEYAVEAIFAENGFARIGHSRDLGGIMRALAFAR